jgi:hypothetical protein
MASSEIISERLLAVRNNRKNLDLAASELAAIGEILTEPSDAADWSGLVLDILGEEMGDWNRARAAISSLRSRLNLHRHPLVTGRLAITSYLAGEIEAYLGEEAEAAAAAGKEAMSCILFVRLTIAEGSLSDSRRNSPIWLVPTLHLTQQVPDDSQFARTLAAICNNIASSLLECDLGDRGNADALLLAARASNRFWSKIGGWVEEERSQYLLALTFNALGDYKKGLEVARSGLSTIDHNGEEDIDRAFLNVELAFAAQNLGDFETFDRSRQLASAIMSNVVDPDLQSWFQKLFAKIK